MTTTDAFAAYLDPVVAIAIDAGAAILRHYKADSGAANHKSDGSPVTAADHDAEAVILAGLKALTPDIPIMSEEQVAAGNRPDVSAGLFWCVDPLDGTKEFVRQTDEFTVCIALVHQGRPTLGVLHSPALGLTLAGCGPDSAVKILADGSRQSVRARTAPLEGKTALVSRSHRDGAELDRYMEQAGVVAHKSMGSAAKFGLIAAGEADLYVRFGPTSEWDTAAGEAVLLAAGGRMSGIDGQPLRYGKEDLLNPGFIAEGAIG